MSSKRSRGLWSNVWAQFNDRAFLRTLLGGPFPSSPLVRTLSTRSLKGVEFFLARGSFPLKASYRHAEPRGNRFRTHSNPMISLLNSSEERASHSAIGGSLGVCFVGWPAGSLSLPAPESDSYSQTTISKNRRGRKFNRSERFDMRPIFIQRLNASGQQ